jgi:hypothetical protein
MSAEEKNKLAQKAILYALNRIRKDANVARVIGVGTETFDLLTAAASALTGEPLEQVRGFVSPGSDGLPHATVEEILAEL